MPPARIESLRFFMSSSSSAADPLAWCSPGDYGPPGRGSSIWAIMEPDRGAPEFEPRGCAGLPPNPPKMSMWTLRTYQPSETGPLTFRLSAGAVKTVGRADEG